MTSRNQVTVHFRLSEINSAIEAIVHQPPGPKLTIAESRDFYDADWTYPQMERLEQRVARVFVQAIRGLEAEWGAPTYRGRFDRIDFPEWCPGIELAYWKRRTRTVAVWWEHQDKEVPILLQAWAPTTHSLTKPYQPTPEEEAAQHRNDRVFYERLGPERATEPCRVPGCGRGAVALSVHCRRHHFHNVTGRACPFSD